MNAPTIPASDDVGKFLDLFFAARREHADKTTAASEEDAAHRAAAEWAEQCQLAGASDLLAASLAERQGNTKEAFRLLEGIDSLAPGLQSTKWFVSAAMLDEVGQMDLAVDAYTRALADPTFPKPGLAWYNLGRVHLLSGRYDEALDALSKALAARDDRRGDVLHTIGIVQWSRGEHTAALESIEAALGEADNPQLGLSWMVKGQLLMELGRGDEAREALNRALEAGDLTDANRVLLHSLFALLDSNLRTEALSAEDRAILTQRGSSGIAEPLLSDRLEELSPEQRILAKIQLAKQTQYEQYLQKSNSGRDNVLSVLRGWSSAVTLLEGSGHVWRGGGYLLRWRGVGIAIDPGFDFLSNMHDAHYHGREVDAVLISHNHPDHNADLGRFDDLRYELYKRRSSDPHGGVSPYVLIWDRGTEDATRFSAEKPEHQIRPMVFDLGRCNPIDIITRPQGMPFSVSYFEVRHGQLRDAVGMRIALHSDQGPDLVVGYTGDTEFFPELADRLSACDILIAHISQPDAEEFSDVQARKKVHLGYRGLADLVRLAKPRLTLVGEFWAGLADLRIDLVHGLRALAESPSILPAGLGMHVQLPSLALDCIECGKPIPFGEARVAPPAVPYGNLAYLCTRCVLV